MLYLILCEKYYLKHRYLFQKRGNNFNTYSSNWWWRKSYYKI